MQACKRYARWYARRGRQEYRYDPAPPLPPILADAVSLDLSPLKPHEWDMTDVGWRAQLLEVKAIWNEEQAIEHKAREWERGMAQGEAGQVG